jgi:hypothetical protein
MSALAIINSTPTDVAVICPLVAEDVVVSELGVNLTGIVQSITDLNKEVKNKISLGNTIMNRMEKGVILLEASVTKTEQYMVIIPALLFAITVLTAFSMMGVVMAWKEKSGVRFQRTMSYVVLPLLILASIACWMVVVFWSTGSMVGSGKN